MKGKEPFLYDLLYEISKNLLALPRTKTTYQQCFK